MTKSQIFRVLGLMSGTSMDGLDMGLFEIHLNNSYDFNYKLIRTVFTPYPKNIRNEIERVLSGLDNSFCNSLLGNWNVEKVSCHFSSNEIDLIALHGQTIAHIDQVMSTQIGNPVVLSNRLNTTVIFNFRQADIDVGGNGAPLMPFLDWLLLRKCNKETITLNIGGISNISYVPTSGIRNDVIGFDTGPGMSLIDECCLYYWNEKFDNNGKRSNNGKIINSLLLELMSHPFIYQSPPKSTGRDVFGKSSLKIISKQYYNNSPEDILRTLVRFTAESIAENIHKFCNFTTQNIQMIVSGGGTLHPLLMNDLSNLLEHIDIISSSKIGICPQFKETLLMAALGVANIKDLPSNMPSCTGSNKLTKLGSKISPKQKVASN